MLEYLLLKGTDITNYWRPRLTYGDPFVCILRGRWFMVTFQDEIVGTIMLPVVCVAIHKDPLRVGIVLLGCNGQTYHLCQNSKEVKVLGPWPTDLTPYMLP